MRYPRPKHSIALAAIAAAVVASPFAVIASNAGPPAGDTRLVDNKQKIANTEIEQVPLRELPAAIVDVASSGLGAAGVKLPPIDPDAFPVPDLTVPLPKGLVPTAGESSAPSASGSRTPEATTTSPDSPSRTKTRSVPGPAPTSTTPPAVTTMRDGREVGAAVTHIVREDPIKMVAFTWDRPVDVDLKLRARQPDGTWSPWTVLEQISKGGVPTADKPAGTEPVWVGDAREVQVAASKDGLAIPAAETQGGDLAQLAVGSASEVVTKLAETALNTLKATLISPEGLLSLGSSLLSPLTGGPQVVARPQWGADEGIRCSQPVYSPQLKGAIVHHTAGSNDYTPAQSIEIVRGIYAYHAQSLNWCDIGYNVLVDKYGQIFEGAFGGLDRNVQGTHTGGVQQGHGRLVVHRQSRGGTADRRGGRRGRTLPALAPRQSRSQPRRHRDPDVRGIRRHQVRGRNTVQPADDLRPPRLQQHQLPRRARVRGTRPGPCARRWCCRTGTGVDAARRTGSTRSGTRARPRSGTRTGPRTGTRTRPRGGTAGSLTSANRTIQANQRSRTLATPSSLLPTVTSSAASSAAWWLCPMATP